jgi:hypothetical protein
LRRNWEAHGTDTVVERNGTFHVIGHALGRSREVRRGQLTPEDATAIFQSIERIDLTSFAARRYAPPPHGTSSWWAYEIVWETPCGRADVKFHSQDGSVPSKLRSIADRIRGAAQ